MTDHDPALGVTYLLIDGENLDATLGSRVLGRRPEPDERPRWDRVLAFAERQWAQPVKSFFFINASSGSMPVGFVQALIGLGLRPIPLSGEPGEPVVDIGIQRTLDAIAGRTGDVMLASHDGDFLDHMSRLSGAGRRLGLLAFPELANAGYSALVPPVEIFDLETDVGCFNQTLPRLRIIALADFDPLDYL
jgi:uncharacterized protein